MDISRAEQRILHLLAQGGRIELLRDQSNKPCGAHCYTREGWRLNELDMALFRKLKRRRTISSEGGKPYRITRRGLQLVRSQPDNC